MWKHDGLKVIALHSGSSDSGLSLSPGHWVVFLGKILYSHGASLHPPYNTGGNPVMD